MQEDQDESDDPETGDRLSNAGSDIGGHGPDARRTSGAASQSVRRYSMIARIKAADAETDHDQADAARREEMRPVYAALPLLGLEELVVVKPNEISDVAVRIDAISVRSRATIVLVTASPVRSSARCVRSSASFVRCCASSFEVGSVAIMPQPRRRRRHRRRGDSSRRPDASARSDIEPKSRVRAAPS